VRPPAGRGDPCRRPQRHVVDVDVDVDSLDAGALAAAEAVRGRAIADLGDEEVYLCHEFCEIGAVNAVEELRAIRTWLDDHPREVLVFVVQDGTAPRTPPRPSSERAWATSFSPNPSMIRSPPWAR